MEWEKRNQEKVSAKHKRFYHTAKGNVNWIKKHERIKWGKVSKDINVELIKLLKEKYKMCPYCTGELKPRADYDHVNPFKPFSKNNLVIACSGCNQSKGNADLLQWMKFKGYKITKEIKELYKKAYK